MASEALRVDPWSVVLRLLGAAMVAYVVTGTVIELFYSANDNVPDGDECGICGHTCALSTTPLNFCSCWITIGDGGGCSCLACIK